MDGWCTVESDPAVFTELMSMVGVQGVQVEELYALDDDLIERIKPVYGLIFLFKWQQRDKDTRPVERDPPFFFASQVISNACATQAILSCLMNCPDVDIGPELRDFRAFTADLPPDLKGMAISNAEGIRNAHNSFARPEPFVAEAKRATDDDDVFHFITYSPINGCVYEMDGLKEGPVNLGAIAAGTDWLDVAKAELQKRIEKYSSTEIRFNLMALIRSRPLVIEEKLAAAKAALAASDAQLAAGDASVADKRATQAADIAELTQQLAEEKERLQRGVTDNLRRRFNYIPFLVNLLKEVGESGELGNMISDAKERKAQKKPPPPGPAPH